MTKATNSPTEPNVSRAVMVAAGVLVAIVLAAVLGVLLLGGDEADDATDAAVSARIPTDGTVRQVSFAEAAGEPLPRLETSGGLDPAIGLPAPTITASYFDNSEVTINFADGQPRAVLFLAHWCTHCQAEVESLVQKFESEGLRDDVELVAISTSVDEGSPNYPPSRWLVREEWPVPVLRDSQNNDLAAGFGLTGTPFLVAVNSEGQVVSRTSGQVPDAQWNLMLDMALLG